MRDDLDIEQALAALGRAIGKVELNGLVEVRMSPAAVVALGEQMGERDEATFGERLDHRDEHGDLVILGGATVIIQTRTVRREP